MQADAVPDKFRRQHIAFEELTEKDNAGNDENGAPLREKLRNRDAQRHYEHGKRAYIGNEADKAAHHADEEAEVQSRQTEADRVVGTEYQAQAGLAVDVSGNRRVDLAGKLAHGVALLQRDQMIDAVDHAVPVAAEVEGDDRRDDQQREDRQQRLTFRPQRSNEAGNVNHRLIHQVAGGAADEVVADEVLEPGIIRIADETLQALRVGRSPVDKSGKLPD